MTVLYSSLCTVQIVPYNEVNVRVKNYIMSSCRPKLDDPALPQLFYWVTYLTYGFRYRLFGYMYAKANLPYYKSCYNMNSRH